MLILSSFALLLSNSLAIRRDVAILYCRIGIIILSYSIYLAYNNLFITSFDNGIGIFGGLFYVSSITQSFHILILILSLFILGMTAFFPRKLIFTKYLGAFEILFSKMKVLKKLTIANIIVKNGEQFSIVEYTLVLLFVITGSILLVSSNDFISVFLSIELQSYGLYLICAVYKNSESSTSSSLTYFLIGALASCLILLGISLIYSNLGITYLDSFYIINNLSSMQDQDINICLILSPYPVLLIIVGLLIKLSAAPFHFWSPDVYDGIPTIVTTFVANIAKISILTLILQLLHFASNICISTGYTWTSSLLLSSLLSLIIGTILGLSQYRIKRLLAYSTIAHLGFMLLALVTNSVESIQSFVFYIIQYSISNINAFILIVAIGYSLYSYTAIVINKHNADKKNSLVRKINQLKGYFHINSVLALSFTITLFSFAGIPPLAGFFAKQMVFSSSLQEGYIFLTLVCVLASVISAVYYLSVIKTMFFGSYSFSKLAKFNSVKIPFLLEKKIYEKKKYIYESKKKQAPKGFYIEKNVSSLSCSFSIVVSLFTLIILLFVLMPNEVLTVSNLLSLELFVYNQ